MSFTSPVAGLDFCAQTMVNTTKVFTQEMGWNSNGVALVHQDVLLFIVSEVKMPCSCYPKVKAIQSRIRKQNNGPSFVTKSTSSRIPTEQT